MDEIAGLVVVFLVIGLIDKVSKKSKKNQKTRDAAKPSANAAAKQTDPSAREVALPVQAVKRAFSGEGVSTQDIQKAIAAARAKAAEAAKAGPKEKEKTSIEQAKALRKPLEKTAIEQAAGSRRPGFADKEGCIGGSIPHTQHEGESKAEHAAHMKRAIRPQTAARPAVSIQKLRTEDMRKAVVMAEILDKPKALRR